VASQETPHLERGAAWPRRAAAQLIDVLVISALAAPPSVFVLSKVDDGYVKFFLLWLVVPPVAALSFHAVSVLAPGSWRGRTPGTLALGLRVVLPDGTDPGRTRTLVRDVLLKWFLFAPLLVPAVLNFLWPLWDHRRRALHDIIVGTLIVREQRQPAPAAGLRMLGMSRTALSGRPGSRGESYAP
jgi:uncharacterized RDD family membrane protein YckC